MKVRFHLAAFRNTTASAAAQKVLRGDGLNIAVMPTPRTIQASCGLSVRFAPEDSLQAAALLSETLGAEEFVLYAALRTEEGKDVFQVLDTLTENT